MKLLIIENSRTIQQSIEATYQGSIFNELKVAPDTEMALTLAKQQNPQVIIIDITTPNLNSIETVSSLLKVSPEAKILIISDLIDHHTTIDLLSVGAGQFLHKPFNKYDFKKSIRDLLNVIPEKTESSQKIPKSTAEQALKNRISNFITELSTLAPIAEKQNIVHSLRAPRLPSNDSNLITSRKIPTSSLERDHQTNIEEITLEEFNKLMHQLLRNVAPGPIAKKLINETILSEGLDLTVSKITKNNAIPLGEKIIAKVPNISRRKMVQKEYSLIVKDFSKHLSAGLMLPETYGTSNCSYNFGELRQFNIVITVCLAITSALSSETHHTIQSLSIGR